MEEDHDAALKKFESTLTNAPKWLKSPFRNFDEMVRYERKYVSAGVRGFSVLENMPDVIVAMKTEWGDPGERYSRILETFRDDAQWIASERSDGFPLLHAHSVVVIWGSLEILIEDLLTSWLSNVPSAWSVGALANIRVPVGGYEQLSTADKARVVLKELARNLSVDFKVGIGKLDPLLKAFSLKPQVHPNVRNALLELWQVRNAIVHCGRRSDKQLVERCPWVEWKVGEPISVGPRLYTWYFAAASSFWLSLMNKALSLHFEDYSGENFPRDFPERFTSTSLPEDEL